MTNHLILSAHNGTVKRRSPGSLCEGDSVKPTSPFWYVAALFIALGSAVISIIIAASAWDPVREASVTPVAERVDASNKSIAVFTDIVQPDRDVTCRAIGPGKKVTEIPALDTPAKRLEISVTNGTDEWHLIGMLNNGDKGQLIRCTPKDRRVDDATYTYAAVDGFTSKGNVAQGVSAIGTAVAVILAGYTFWCRRKQRLAARTP